MHPHDNRHYSSTNGASMMTSIATCITSLDLACRTLEASNTTLAQETSDLERIANVVRSKRHFDLISEREIKDAQDHLSVEILPQLKELILRAEGALQKDERRAKLVRGKSVQQLAKLDQLSQLYDLSINQMRRMVDADQNGTATAVEEEGGKIERLKEDPQDKAKRMNEHLSLLREKRITLQKEMANMEKSIRQARQGNS